MINRKGTIYVQLPEELKTKRKDTVKLTISISITGLESMEGKKGIKFIDEQVDEVGRNFKKFARRHCDKALGKDK